MKIYIGDFKRKRNTKIEDIFEKITDNTYKNVTYLDKECTAQQCKGGAARSFDDIISIVQTYFPNSKPENILKRLFKFIKQYNDNKILNIDEEDEEDWEDGVLDISLKLFIWCPDVNKIVLQNNWGLDKEDYDNDECDKYLFTNYSGFTLEKKIDEYGDSDYSYRDFLKISGIKY